MRESCLLYTSTLESTIGAVCHAASLLSDDNIYEEYMKFVKSYYDSSKKKMPSAITLSALSAFTVSKRKKQ